MENNFIVIAVILPICLHLDERIFKIPYKKETFIEIKTKNFFSNKYSRVGTATNMEIKSDTFSQFRFTNFQMKMPHFGNEKIDLEKIAQKYEKAFFKYYNKFIDAYRIVSGREKIRNYWNFNEFLKPINVSASHDINPEEYQVVSWDFGDEPLVNRQNLRTEDEHKLLEEYLTKELLLYKQFILDAQRDFLFGNYIQCNLNAVIALEIMVSDYIRNYAAKKGIDTNSIDNFIKDVGLTGNIKITIKLITPNEIALPSDETFSNCKTAITTRNKIVHQGLRGINETELEKNLNSIEELINFCKRI